MAGLTTGLGQWVQSINPTGTSTIINVPKSSIRLVNCVGSWVVYRSASGAEPNDPAFCTWYFNGTALYASKPFAQLTTGDIVYTDYALTAPFNGNNLYYGLNLAASSSAGWPGDNYQINTIGVIGSHNSCGF